MVPRFLQNKLKSPENSLCPTQNPEPWIVMFLPQASIKEASRKFTEAHESVLFGYWDAGCDLESYEPWVLCLGEQCALGQVS